MRRIDGCRNCEETREIAAYGLCFKCYRRDERVKDRQFALADRHNPGLRREHKKLLRAFTNVMVGLADLGVSRTDVLAIREILQFYLDPIATFLAPTLRENEGPVNREQELKSSSQFTEQQKFLLTPNPRDPNDENRRGDE